MPAAAEAAHHADRRNGKLPAGVTAKDLALGIIGKIGTDGGTGYVIEFTGEAIRALSMEGRMTLCNMSIEAGARAGMVAPDETTFDLLERPASCAAWRRLGQGAGPLEDAAHRSGRALRRIVEIDASSSRPTSPGERVPAWWCR